jgi:hypothetical protein
MMFSLRWVCSTSHKDIGIIYFFIGWVGGIVGLSLNYVLIIIIVIINILLPLISRPLIMSHSLRYISYLGPRYRVRLYTRYQGEIVEMHSTEWVYILDYTHVFISYRKDKELVIVHHFTRERPSLGVSYMREKSSLVYRGGTNGLALFYTVEIDLCSLILWGVGSGDGRDYHYFSLRGDNRKYRVTPTIRI